MSTQKKDQHKLVCSIDPTTRGLAFAVMEGPLDLLDWGTAEARINTHRRCLKKLRKLLAHYQPQVLILQNPGTHKGRRATQTARLLKDAARLATAQGMTVQSYPQADIQDVFARFKVRTKHEIAVTIAEWLPELEPALPRKRKPWMGEDERMNVFDAVALSIAYYYFNS